LAEGEQDAEFKGLQIDLAKQELADAPDKKRQAQEMYDAKMQQIKQSNDLAEIELGAATMGYMAKRLSPSMMKATELGMAGDIEGGLLSFKADVDKLIKDEETPEAVRRKLAGMAGEDKVWQPEELAGAKMAVGEWLQREGGKRTPRSVLVDGQPAVVMIDDAGNAFYEDGGPVMGKVTPFATNEGGVIGTDPRTGTQRGAAYDAHLGSFNDSTNVQELITDALPRVNKLPDTVGVKGWFATAGAGLLTTFGRDEAANRFAEWVGGASAEEIAEIQTQLQVIRSRIIPITTGEESSRISDNERDIANKTVGVIDGIRGPADLTKAYPQVMGAMTQLYIESWANKYNLASQDQYIEYPYDLNNDTDVEKLFDEFFDAGIEVETAKRAVTRLAKIQGISP
jgi:hypothetical protein